MTNTNGHGGSALLPDPASLDTQKRSARSAALAARRGLDPALGIHLADHVLASGLICGGMVVAGFWPLDGEIDVRSLMTRLHDAGHTLALPRTPPRGNPLTFHRWAPGDALTPGVFGTRHPSGPAVVPDALLVPLLAFDAAGVRLGYGGGYYDRTLAGLPGALAIGCAFAAQQIAAVPAGPHDIRMDAVATESGVLRMDSA